MNHEESFPTILVQCKDKPRYFSMNLEAFRVLEEYHAEKSGNPNFNILKDYNWEQDYGNIRSQLPVLWAGFHYDARVRLKEALTIEHMQGIIDLADVAACQLLIFKALQRVLPKQDELLAQEAEAKKLAAARNRKIKKSQRKGS